MGPSEEIDMNKELDIQEIEKQLKTAAFERELEIQRFEEWQKGVAALKNRKENLDN
jgi:hypothetical protein